MLIKIIDLTIHFLELLRLIIEVVAQLPPLM